MLRVFNYKNMTIKIDTLNRVLIYENFQDVTCLSFYKMIPGCIILVSRRTTNINRKKGNIEKINQLFTHRTIKTLNFLFDNN